MLHELYFKLLAEKQTTIEKYQADNRLQVLGLYRLKDLFRSRKKTLKHIDGSTSPLHELSNYEVFEFKDIQEIEEIEIEQIKIEKIKQTIFDGILNQDHEIEVFVMAQIEPLYRMAKRTNISRSSLKKAYENARIKLKT